MFPDLDKTEVKVSANYLTAGVHEVKVDSVKSSESIDGYTGTPYTEFKVSNGDGVSFLKFKGVEKGVTSEVAARIRKEIVKEFLTNCGVTDYSEWITSCRSAVGANITLCLANREYWTNDKDSGEPVIKTITDYKFSKREGQSINWLESYNKSLKPSDMEAFKGARDAYIAASTSQAGVGNSPF